MAALMTSDFDDTDRLAIEIAECTHMGIAVLAPDVNESFLEFAVVAKDKSDAKPKIRFGMKAIKNVGSGAVEEILRARAEAGHFDTLEDFLANVSPNLVNRKVMESLIKAGAFDNLGDRSKLLHNLDTVMAFSVRLHKDAASGQADLFGGLADEHVRAKLELAEPAVAHNIREKLTWERELLGLYLSQHPLDSFAEYLAEQTVPLDYLKPEHDNKAVTVGGSIIESREILTKKGQKMAFVRIEDKHASIEVILFPGAYQKTLGLWRPDTVVLINGKASAKGRDGELEDEVKILVDDAREITLEQAENYQPTGKTVKLPKLGASQAAKAAREAGKAKRVYVRLPGSDDQALLMKLKAAIDARAGQDEVVLVMGADNAKQIIRLPGGIKSDKTALGELRELVGTDNVKFQ
jgi:DNA polymerase-3 subunit alpha